MFNTHVQRSILRYSCRSMISKLSSTYGENESLEFQGPNSVHPFKILIKFSLMFSPLERIRDNHKQPTNNNRPTKWKNNKNQQLTKVPHQISSYSWAFAPIGLSETSRSWWELVDDDDAKVGAAAGGGRCHLVEELHVLIMCSHPGQFVKFLNIQFMNEWQD